MNDLKRYFIAFTPYHLLLSMLISLDFEERDDVIIIDKDNINNANNIVQRLTEYFPQIIFKIIEERSASKKFFKSSNLIKVYKTITIRKWYPKKYQDNAKIFSDKGEVFIFNEARLISRYLLNKFKKNIILIEDGLSNYTRYKIKFKDKIKKLFGIYPPFGRNPCIKKIIVQNPEKLPDDIREKGEYLNLKQLVDRLTEENKDKIIKAFLNRNLLKSFLNLNQGKRILLLTQPFSENKAITETQKITLYKNIIDKYLDNDELLIIKPHPAEKTDYTKLSLYKNLVQLPREFPIELINIMPKFNITKAITLFSSAIDNIDVPQKITICPNPFDCPELIFPSGNNSIKS